MMISRSVMTLTTAVASIPHLRFRAAVGFALLGLAVGLPSGSRAEEVHWKLFAPVEDAGTLPPAGDLRIACGNYGIFDLVFGGTTPESSPDPNGPQPMQTGDEVPRGYPRITTTAPVARVEALEPTGTEPVNPLPLRTAPGAAELLLDPRGVRGTEAPPLPCAGGDCFSPPAGGPWVAVVDWNTWHGWSVGWTLLTLANHQLPASLFPVDDPALSPYFGDQVTDLHVLLQLCRVAEAAGDPAGSPPVAVNMSFGRLASPGDALDAGCDPSTFACQIGRVIDHLRGLEPPGPNPVLVVASAGNHGLLLFPAAYEGAVAAGSLDLTRFGADGATVPSWETPAAAGALFPGNGLCLEYPVAVDQQAFWPAPPGSSYATAVFTGWLAPALAERAVPPPFAAGLWVPAYLCSGGQCAHRPSRGGVGYGSASPPAESLLSQILGTASSPCDQSPANLVTTARALGAAEPLSALPPLAFPEVSPTLHHPTPEPSPCVPCEEGNGLTQGLRLAPLPGGLHSGRRSGPGSGLRTSTLTTLEDVSVELWASLPLPPEIALDALYLRVEDQVYAVLLSAEDLVDLAGGALGRLELTGSGRLLGAAQDQPSLVFVLRETPPDGSPETVFWTSSPLLVH